MAARSIGSGTISFGLVSIPIRVYVATHAEGVAFNMLHEECGSRIKQQLWCPQCEAVVGRGATVKGYQFQKDRYVTFSSDELKALEAAANRSIDIQEFVPLAEVDPIYFEHAHYLGPDKGAEKAYHLLSAAMQETGKVAVAQFTSHGKEHIVLIRPYDEGLIMHTLYYADEVRSFAEVPSEPRPKVREGEAQLARRLIEELASDRFRPQEYEDMYRERVQAAVERKVAGEEITVAEPAAEGAQVIDLMQALKDSLANKTARRGPKARAAAAEPKRRAAAARGGGGRARRERKR